LACTLIIAGDLPGTPGATAFSNRRMILKLSFDSNAR
jgi:hypothetical protein